MFLVGKTLPLIAQHLEGGDESWPRILRFDYVVQISQLRRDMQDIWVIFDKYAGRNQGRLGMRKLADALDLLGMPIYNSSASEDNDGMVVGSGSRLGLWDVEKRVFDSNESARLVLEELGLENLTEAEARMVLGRRVELVS